MFEAAEKEIQEIAKLRYPNEACGFILLDGTVAEKENKADKPRDHFFIDPKDYPLEGYLAAWHSHPDGKAEPSKDDMQAQFDSAKPQGIVACTKERTTPVLWWGHGVPIPELVGRPFRHGPSGTDGGGDCYALIRDYYQTVKNITLKDFARTEDWWEHGVSMYTDLFGKAGFERITESEILPGDVFLSMVRSKVPNHGGIYLGDGVILHHLHNRLSKRDTVHRWKKYITHWLRYTGV